MTIYTRFGAECRLIRKVNSVDELPPEEERDDYAKERIELGMWYIASLHIDGKEIATDRVVDLALCRADGGSKEIDEAAKALEVSNE